eukprot:15463138-Alexandrium_andersonii.AAC.1
MGGPPAAARQGAGPLGHARASLARAGLLGSAQCALEARPLLQELPGLEGRALTSSILCVPKPFFLDPISAGAHKR